MNAEQRRHQLKAALEASPGTPVSASSLASRFQVSRQVIVGDIALLRAAGADIAATPRGYVIAAAAGGLRRTVACIHNQQDMERELNIIVDNGCTAVDVIVEHPIYGQLTGQLCLSSRYDVSRFVQKCSGEARPLSSLTGGIHLHTVECPDEVAYRRVMSELSREGFLLSEE